MVISCNPYSSLLGHDHRAGMEVPIASTHPTFEVRYSHEPVRIRHRYLNVDRFESWGLLCLNQLARPETFCPDRNRPSKLPVTGGDSASSCCRFLHRWI